MNPFDLIKNMGNIKKNMAEAQEKIKAIVVEGAAGGDMVRVQMDGQFFVRGIEIAPECVDPRDIPMLQDIVVAAINDATTKVKQKIQEEMSSMTGGMGGMFPGMMG